MEGGERREKTEDKGEERENGGQGRGERVEEKGEERERRERMEEGKRRWREDRR